MKENRITLKAVTLCLALCLFTVALCDMVLPGEEVQVYDSLIRLHILANSDSAEDQAIKLKVRDAILAAEVFGSAETVAEAEVQSLAAAEKGVAVANAVLEAEGVPYRASLKYGTERYPTRQYGQLTLPAGTYRSLRIVLGEGEGQNWWCVLFPPLCTGAADSLTAINDGNGTASFFKTGNTRYKLKLKIFEWLFS